MGGADRPAAERNIERRRAKVRHPQTNGFAERFHPMVKEECFAAALCETLYESVEALQADLDRWLVPYNTERPHLGERTLGNPPIDTINVYLSVAQEAS